MGSLGRDIKHDVPPYIRVYKDGTVERLAGTDVIPPTFDTVTGVTSKDIIISPQTPLSARIFLPPITTITTTQKLPLIIYFHGGAFVISSPADPLYHHSLTNLVSESHAVVLSIDYRLAPEHPLPTAFHDSYTALQWISSHAPVGSEPGSEPRPEPESGSEPRSEPGSGSEEWIKQNVDFDRVFLAGDSAGAAIAHHLAIRVGSKPDPEVGFKISGMILINPYFWGKDPIGSEKTDPVRKAMVDKWWEFVCPLDSEHGLDDPLINPLVNGAPDLAGLGCGRVIITVCERDILRERGWAYYEALVKSNWKGEVEMVEIEGEDHVFHIFDPNGDKAVNMMKKLATFINK